MAGVLNAEQYRLHLTVVWSLDAASNPSALCAHEVALNVPADDSVITIVHGYSMTPRAFSS